MNDVQKNEPTREKTGIKPMIKISKIQSCKQCTYFMEICSNDRVLGFVCVHPNFVKYRDIGDIIVSGLFPDWCPLETTSDKILMGQKWRKWLACV